MQLLSLPIQNCIQSIFPFNFKQIIQQHSLTHPHKPNYHALFLNPDQKSQSTFQGSLIFSIQIIFKSHLKGRSHLHTKVHFIKVTWLNYFNLKESIINNHL